MSDLTVKFNAREVPVIAQAAAAKFLPVQEFIRSAVRQVVFEQQLQSGKRQQEPK